jgi:catechol 2,3-dioxygenase-like lactoylglutathione lyase family enzyme
MAHVDYVLAVVAVRDIEAGKSWYTKLFGRAPDNNPMPNLIEWQVTDGAWVQVTEDPQRAGNGMLNLAVSDIEEGARELRQRGIDADEIIDANKGVRLCPFTDPDNNNLQLVGNFRVKY